MPLRSHVALCIFAVTFAACGAGEKKAPRTPGELKEFTSVCDKANDGKRIAVVGYLRLPDEVSRKTGPVLRMYPTTDFDGKPVGVSTEIGSGPGQIGFIPKEFTHKDLKVNIADGQVAGFGTKVKVSGDVYFPIVAGELQCALSNPLVELAK